MKSQSQRANRTFQNCFPPSANNSQLTFDFAFRKFDIDLIRIHCGRLFYSQRLLVEHHGVPENSLKTRRSENKKNISKNYAFDIFFCSDGNRMFFYDAETLPKKLFIDYRLPSLIEAAKQFGSHFQLRIKLNEETLPRQDSELLLLLNSAIDRAYKHEHLFYRTERFAPISNVLSQKFAVLDLIRSYLVQPPTGATIKCLREILSSPSFTHLGFPKKAPAFYSYLARARDAKDLVKFTLGRQAINDNAKKVNDQVLRLICLFGGHGNPISAEKVMIFVNTVLIVFPKINGKKLLCIRTVQTKLVESKTKIRIFREGEDFVRKHLAAYLHMHDALNPFDQFFMDEWWIEFACNSSGKRLRKIVLGMMDGRSKKMVNHVIVKVLNKEVIQHFLQETIVLCRDKFSAELVCDFASYNVCGELRRILNYLVNKNKDQERKFVWTVSSNPNRKVAIERFWETFGSYYLTPHFGATGQGVTATREKAFPAKIIEILIQDPKFLDDELEVDRFIHHFMAQYCKKGIHIELDSPNEVFRNNKPTNSIRIEPVDIAFMFGRKQTRKYSRSEVQFEGRCYQTFDNEISELCHDHLVDVYHHERFPDSLFVFKRDTNYFFGELVFHENHPKAKANQTADHNKTLNSHFEMQEQMVQNSLALKPQAIAKIKEVTNGVDPCSVGMVLIDMLKPQCHTSVRHLNPSVKNKIEVDPFNPKLKRGYQKAGKSGQKKSPPIQSTGLMSDNLTSLLG